jgi:hypothetical protein
MPTPDVNDLLSRVTTIAQEGLTSIGEIADVVPYFIHTQGAFPYLTARISNVTNGDYTEESASEDFVTDVYTVTLRLIVAHLTADYEGRTEERLYDMMPAVREYLKRREGLQHANALTMPPYLRYALLTGMTGLQIFVNSGVNTTTTQQVGCQFTIECTFDYPLEQDYY